MNTLTDLPLFGTDYDPARDEKRLRGKMRQVFRLMADEQWRTSEQAAEECRRRYGTHFKESSVGRYLRLFETPGIEGWTREKRGIGNGIYEYRLVRQ